MQVWLKDINNRLKGWSLHNNSSLRFPSAHNQVCATFCHQADLAGKDFAAEKEHVIVISTGAVAPVDHERLAAERKEAEDRNRHR